MALNRKDKRPDANNWWWMLWRPWQFIKTCTTVKIPTPRTRWGFTAGLHQGYRRNILWPSESEDWIQDHVILTAVVTSKLLVVFFFNYTSPDCEKRKKAKEYWLIWPQHWSAWVVAWGCCLHAAMLHTAPAETADMSGYPVHSTTLIAPHGPLHCCLLHEMPNALGHHQAVGCPASL